MPHREDVTYQPFERCTIAPVMIAVIHCLRARCTIEPTELGQYLRVDYTKKDLHCREQTRNEVDLHGKFKNVEHPVDYDVLLALAK